MFIAYTPGPDIYDGYTCNKCDTYEEAVSIANWFYEKTGIVVAVEEVAQDRLINRTFPATLHSFT